LRFEPCIVGEKAGGEEDGTEEDAVQFCHAVMINEVRQNKESFQDGR